VLKQNQKLRNLEFRKRQTIPEHTAELFRLSTDGLDKHQKSEVKRLLSEYSDVFAQDDLDVGNLRDIRKRIFHLGKGDIFLCLFFLFSCINTVFFSLIELFLLQYCFRHCAFCNLDWGITIYHHFE
jgi:hypothetical protein